MKVCIIDDLVSNTEVIAKFLKLKGHETVTTNSGKKGLSLLENEIFDVTILDVSMPDISGITSPRRATPQMLHGPPMWSRRRAMLRTGDRSRPSKRRCRLARCRAWPISRTSKNGGP